MRILQELHKKGGVLSLPFCCQTPHPPPPPPKKTYKQKLLDLGSVPIINIYVIREADMKYVES